MSFLSSLLAPLANLFRSVGGLPVPKELHEAEREDDVLAVAGQLAMVEAVRLWRLDVFDPRHNDTSEEADRCRAIIDGIVRSDAGAGWSWLEPYRGDGAKENPQWCGMFQAWAWSKWIPLATRKTWFPSTYRLDAWARYAAIEGHPNPRPKTGPHRKWAKFDGASRVLPFEPQEGDILLVGDGSPDYGDHVCGVLSYDPERHMFRTVEGNGVGVGPKGNRRQGIVVAERPLGRRRPNDYHVRRLIRPAPSDLVDAGPQEFGRVTIIGDAP